MAKSKFIALLRGINVSGQKKIIMKELKQHFIDYGFENVVTYIQSGNIIFDTDYTVGKCQSVIKEMIQTEYGFEVEVFIVTNQTLKNSIKNNPFLKDEFNPKGVYFTYFDGVPAKENIDFLRSFELRNEQYVIRDKEMYLYLPDGAGKSKLSNNLVERKLKIKATSRNLNTINKLIELSEM